MRFRCVDAFQSDAMLRVRGIKECDRITISDGNDGTAERLPIGLDGDG